MNTLNNLNHINSSNTLTIHEETCVPIEGFERYHISESGRIYRTDSERKRTWRTKGKLYISECKIHFRETKNGLRQGQASLTDKDGKLCNVGVAPLVAKAFGIVAKLKKKETIGYKDGNKKNLHYTNLFVTEQQRPTHKLTSEDVKHIKKLIRKKVPLSRIGLLYGVSDMQINRIKTGENWGTGKRKIKAPEAPFEIKDGKLRRYIANFEREKVAENIRKPFVVKRTPKQPTNNTIVGILRGYKLSSKNTNITQAKKLVKKLNDYFF